MKNMYKIYLCIISVLGIGVGVAIFLYFKNDIQTNNYSEKSIVLGINEKLSLNSLNIKNIKNYNIKSLTPNIIEYDGEKIIPKASGEGIIELTSDENVIWIKIIVDSKNIQEETNKEIMIESINTSLETIDIKEGETYNIIINYLPIDATNNILIWTSSDEKVASVDGTGKVTGLKEGEVTIIVQTINDKKIEIKVKVLKVDDLDKIEAETIILSYSSVTLKEEESILLKEKIIPENTTNKTITWISSNNSIAKVLNGKVTGIKEGTATITAKTGNGKESKCQIIVTKKDSSSTSPVSEPSENILINTILLNKTSLSLEVGLTETLTTTISPSNATDKTITWISSDPGIASISNGKITAIKVGSTVITAKTSNGKIAKCTVTVKAKTIDPSGISVSTSSLNLDVGSSKSITATIAPSNATNKTITWTSSDLGVATVINGVVKAVKEGTTVITAKTSNGKIATCTVKVMKLIIVDNGESVTLYGANVKTWATSNANVTLVTQSNTNYVKVTGSVSKGVAYVTGTTPTGTVNYYVGVSLINKLDSINVDDIIVQTNGDNTLASSNRFKPIKDTNAWYTIYQQDFMERYLTQEINKAGGGITRGGTNYTNSDGIHEGSRAGAVIAARFLALQFQYGIPYAGPDGNGVATGDFSGNFYSQAGIYDMGSFIDINALRLNPNAVNFTYGYNLNIHHKESEGVTNPDITNRNGLGCWGCLTGVDYATAVNPITGVYSTRYIKYHGFHCTTFVQWNLLNSGLDIMKDTTIFAETVYGTKLNNRNGSTLAYLSHHLPGSTCLNYGTGLSTTEWSKVKVGDLVWYGPNKNTQEDVCGSTANQMSSAGHIGIIIGIDKARNFMYIAHQASYGTSGRAFEGGISVDRVQYKGTQTSTRKWNRIIQMDGVYETEGIISDMW